MNTFPSCYPPKRMRHLALASTLLLSAALPSPAHACSVAPDWLYRPSTYFIATVLPDVVPASPGDVRFYTDMREQTVDTTAIDARKVRLDQVGGTVSPHLASALQRGIREAVLVPWSYGADCRTTRWPDDVPWVPVGTAGLFPGRLRDEGDWVAGLPTFDVFHAYSHPYPHGDYRGKPATPDSMLTARQLFALYERLPVWSRERETTYADVEPLLRWARENPELAHLHPVQDALESAYRAIQPCRSATKTSPVAGTYRLEVVVPGDPPRELFIRTSPEPSGPDCSEDVQLRDPGRFAPRSAERYRLYVHGAPTPEAIPEANREAIHTGCSVTRLRVGEEPRVIGSGVRVLSAHLDWGMLARCFPGDTAIPAAMGDKRVLGHAVPVGESTGEIRLRPDGGAEFEQVLRRDGRVVLSIRGERIPGGGVLSY